MLTMKALEVISKALDIIAADEATDNSHGIDTGEHGGDTDVSRGRDTDICHGRDTGEHGGDTDVSRGVDTGEHGTDTELTRRDTDEKWSDTDERLNDTDEPQMNTDESLCAATPLPSLTLQPEKSVLTNS